MKTNMEKTPKIVAIIAHARRAMAAVAAPQICNMAHDEAAKAARPRQKSSRQVRRAYERARAKGQQA